jgi:hypothetical protein
MKKTNVRFKMVLSVTAAFAVVFISTSWVYAGWQVISSPHLSSDWSLNSVQFTSNEEGWAVGSDFHNMEGVLLHYSGGAWSSVTPPPVSSDWELFSVHFTSPNEGWAVGRDNSSKKGVLLHYRNGSWTSVSASPTVACSASPSWHLNSVHFTSANEGWAVGEDSSCDPLLSGVLLHYLNGTWTSVNPPLMASSSWNLYSVNFSSNSEGWAVGVNVVQRKGALLRYANDSWAPITPPNAGRNWDVQSIQLTSSDEGWAVGNDYQYPVDTGLLFHYSKGSWTPIRRSHSSLSWYLSSTHFVSSTEGWAVGADVQTSSTQTGLLMHYLDGSWSFVTPPDVSSIWGLTGVYFTSSDEGWAVGRDEVYKEGVLLRFMAQPEINVAPVSNDFGSLPIGKASKKTIIVRNDGERNLLLDTIKDPPSPFHRSGGTCTGAKVLIPRGTCSIVAQFIPVEDGDFTSEITISSNDPREPSTTVTLSGRSGPADLTGEWQSLTQTCTPYRGSTRCKLTGTLTVQNIGYSTSRSSSIKFYLSDNKTFVEGEAIYLKKSSLAGIKIGAHKSIKFSHTLPLGVSASRYVIAVIDPDDKVVELKEDNNAVVSDEVIIP